MFNGGTKGPSARPLKRNENADNSVTILTSGCHFTGKLYCSGSTRIGGTIEGEIISEGILIVEEKARINANIKAEEVVIQGVVEGRIEAQIRLEICQAGNFSGDILTSSLVVREGAKFNGRSVMVTAESLDQDSSEYGLRSPEVTAALEGFGKTSPEVSLL